MTGLENYKVYVLKNRQNEVVYVGQTKLELTERLTYHKNLFEERRDLTIHLISEVPSIEAAFYLEAKLIEQYGIDSLLNKTLGHNPNHKTRDHYRENQKDKSNGFYKHKQSEYAKKVLSERSKGNQYAKNNPSRKGRKNSKEHNESISKHKSKKVMCIDTGEVFKSGRQAAKKLNLQSSKISLVCNGKRKSTGGLRFCFVD
jgi:hypothetical protein